MGVRGVLSSSKVVIVLNSIRIFVPDHFRSYCLKFVLFDKKRKIDYSDIAVFITKN